MVALFGGIASAATTPPSITPSWSGCSGDIVTEASVLVAVDPEWARDGKMFPAAKAALAQLADAGAQYLRFLNFNIFPGISCAELSPGKWDFSVMDPLLEDFMDAVGNSSVMIDIETSPDWMWLGANASTNHTCANATSVTLPVGPRNRCPYFGDPQQPRDSTWREIAQYFKRVGDWYTQGGFDDDSGSRISSNHHYHFDRWEVMNEVNHPREHDFTPASYIAAYDATVAAMTAAGATAPGDKFLGPSLGGLTPSSAAQWLGPMLNPANHTPSSTPVGGVSFHTYASCDNQTAAGLEPVFGRTDARVAAAELVGTLRQKYRPDAELHMTESGLLCNSPNWCDVNNYTCWYRDFPDVYWVASGSQWLYQYLITAEAANLTSIGQSQLLGYPYQFNGLSGEWPCGTMIDWDRLTPNTKHWTQIALLENVARPFNFCSAPGAWESSSLNTADLYAQPLQSSKGRIVVVTSKRMVEQQVTVAGSAGKTALVLDQAYAPARKITLSGDTVTLEPFVTMLIQW
jgi:hypothetical protein